jgi:hypothetical protein
MIFASEFIDIDEEIIRPLEHPILVTSIDKKEGTVEYLIIILKFKQTCNLFL